MVFWVGVLVGGLFAWLAVKMGFYWAWAALFNIVISVYLAIFLGPIIPELIPGVGEGAYSDVLAILSIGLGAFLILHCLSVVLLTAHFRVSFPRLIDSLGAMLLGFLAGFLAWSFVGLLVCMTPVAQHKLMKEIGFGSQSQQTSLANVGWWCDLVHGVVSSEGNESTSKEVIDELLKKAEGKRREKSDKEAEPSRAGKADANNI